MGLEGREDRVRQTRWSGRSALASAALATALGLAGCGGNSEQGAMTADLERDLQLALSAAPPRTAVVSAIEGGPVYSPSGNQRGRRDAVPTPRRMPRPTPEAEVQETSVTPELEEASAPSVEVTTQTVQAPAPIPEPTAQAPSTEGILVTGTARGPSHGSGEADGGGRRGGGWGTGVGVIIRGGAAGDDNCEEHDRRRTGRRGGGTIINVGGGGVMGGIIGGMIGNGGGIRPTFPRY